MFNTNGYIWQFLNNGLSRNAYNNTVWNVTSDHRIKENIKKANLNICYNNVKNINLYRFNYINGFNKGTQHDKTQLGFIAQQVQQHYPKSVFRSKTRIEDKREIPDLASVSTDQVNFTLFGAVKQLMRVVEKQSKRIKKLEEMLGIIDDDEVENDADEPYERIVCDEVDIDDIEPSEHVGV
jgi:predicted AlkP superfamily pyrophosphatase or phosphodiesterase